MGLGCLGLALRNFTAVRPFNPGRRLQFLNNLQDSSQGKMVTVLNVGLTSRASPYACDCPC